MSEAPAPAPAPAPALGREHSKARLTRSAKEVAALVEFVAFLLGSQTPKHLVKVPVIR
jgi:hypothetical protein